MLVRNEGVGWMNDEYEEILKRREMSEMNEDMNGI